MYLLEVDPVRNHIHITLSGVFSESDAKALHDELKERVSELKADFNVLCDLSPLKNFDKSARPHYRAIMELCSHSGVRKVIRIIPDSLNNFGITIMSIIHYDSTVLMVNCETLEEAFKHL